LKLDFRLRSRGGELEVFAVLNKESKNFDKTLGFGCDANSHPGYQRPQVKK